jgi:hypothetical protein
LSMLSRSRKSSGSVAAISPSLCAALCGVLLVLSEGARPAKFPDATGKLRQ